MSSQQTVPPRRLRWLVIGLCLIGSSVWVAALPYRTHPPAFVFQATLTAEPLSHDFGRVSADERLSTTFRLVNRTGTTVTIEEVSKSCGGCTDASVDATRLEPGKAGVLTVQWKPTGKGGVQSVAVIVNYTRAATPQRREFVICQVRCDLPQDVVAPPTESR